MSLTFAQGELAELEGVGLVTILSWPADPEVGGYVSCEQYSEATGGFTRLTKFYGEQDGERLDVAANFTKYTGDERPPNSIFVPVIALSDEEEVPDVQDVQASDDADSTEGVVAAVEADPSDIPAPVSDVPGSDSAGAAGGVGVAESDGAGVDVASDDAAAS